MYNTGEKPGKGDYKCIHCLQVITLDDNSDTLPPCPKCSRTEWVKN
ncbi:zinc ribbon-containing protein [Methanogenium organophilum]